MTAYTLKDVEERLPAVLATLARDGKALLVGPGGTAFEIRAHEPNPADWSEIEAVPGLKLDDVLSVIRESRDRDYPWIDKGEDASR